MPMVRSLLAALCVSSCLAGSAQERSAMRFDRIDTDDGLPGHEVLCLHEDREGFIWIGTASGLARHEGVRIRTFHHDRKDSTSLSNDQVNAIAEDPQGGLWFGTANGFCRYDRVRNTFERHRIAAASATPHLANRIHALWCEGDSVVWVGTEEGAYRLHRQSGRITRLTHGALGDLPHPKTSLRAFAPDPSHRGLWIATHGGPAFFDLAARSFHHHLRPREGWKCLIGEEVDACIPDGRGGLFLFRTRARSLRHHAAPGRPPEDRDVKRELGHAFTCQWLAIDRSGALWLSSWMQDLLRLERPDASWSSVVNDPSDAASIPSSNVKCFLETSSGDLWFGTVNGIGIASPEVQGYTRLWRSPLDPIMTILPGADHRVYVGTEGDGLAVLDLRTGTVRTVHFPGTDPPPPQTSFHDHVTDVRAEPDGTLRVATMVGLYALDTVQWQLRMPPEALAAPWAVTRSHVAFTLRDRSGGTWVGTYNHGLYHRAPGQGDWQQWHAVDTADVHISNGHLLCALEDRSGRRWFGLNNGGGLLRLDPGQALPTPAMRRSDGQEPSGVVRCLAEGPDGRIWIGTHETGIEVLDPRTGMRSFLTRSDGLPGNRVYDILFAPNGTTWIATDQGIAYRPAGAAGFTALPLPEGFKPRDVAPDIALLGDGRVLLGLDRDLVAVDPRLALARASSPAARITTLIAGDRLLGAVPADGVTLKHDNRTFALELGAVGSGARGALVLAYRIPGLQDAWTSIGAAKRLDLNALPKGMHRIELRAGRNGADTGGAVTHMDVLVLPPFWSTGWFRLGVLLLVSVVVWLSLRLYVQRRLAAQRMVFERQQAVLQERMRIAGDMHDDLGAGLSALKLRSEMALRVEKDPVKRQQLGQLAASAGELIGSMRQIIWTMNTDQSALEDLVAYTTSYARQYCEQHQLHIAVTAPETWPARVLTSEQRRNVFLVVKEALHNVVKHAHAREVRLELQWQDGLLVGVEDDGVGVGKAAEQGEGNGMRNMRRRVEALGGRFTVMNGQGTRVQAHVPLPP